MSERGNASSFEDGLVRTSASAIETFRMCQRKWAWAKIEKIAAPSNRFAALGTKVHGVLEAYLRHGVPPDLSTREGRIAAAGLEYLPIPGTADIEDEFRLTTDVARYLGYKDMGYWLTDVEIDGLHFDELRVVGDHKTTSDLKWAKTPDVLRTDVQAILYAADELIRRPIEHVGLDWIYYVTQEGKERARRVRLVVHREHVEQEFVKIEETAAEIGHVQRTVTRALDLPPTVSACAAYGGCPFEDHCNISPMERLKATMAQETLAEKMKRQAAERAAANGEGSATAPATAPATPAATAAPVNPPASSPPAGSTKPAGAPTTKPGAVPSSSAGGKAVPTENDLVVALLEELEPGAIRAARAALKKLRELL